MRTQSAQIQYNLVKEGRLGKKEFIIQMRKDYPQFISQFNGFDDTLQILRNKGILVEQIDAGVAIEDRFSLNAVDRGIDYELEVMGLDSAEHITDTQREIARLKVLKNLSKDPVYYYHKIASTSSKDNHNDKPEPATKSNTVDTPNGMKKVSLKEGIEGEAVENNKQTIAFREMLGRTEVGTSDDIEAYLDKLHRDYKGNPESYISWNINDYVNDYKKSVQDREEHGVENTPKSAPVAALMEDEKVDQNQIKEAVKDIIRKVLSEEKQFVSEAAAKNLEGFIYWENDKNEDLARRVRKSANDLADHIYAIEKQYIASREKLEDILKNVGPYMAPALAEAFKKDIRPVLSRYYDLKVPVAPELSQEDLDAIQAAKDSGQIQENKGKPFSAKNGTILKK